MRHFRRPGIAGQSNAPKGGRCAPPPGVEPGSKARSTTRCMDDRKHRLESAIDALEAQRSVLGDGVVDAAIAPLRAELALLQSEPAAQAPRLKHVSVLFLDVVGSTALAQPTRRRRPAGRRRRPARALHRGRRGASRQGPAIRRRQPARGVRRRAHRGRRRRTGGARRARSARPKAGARARDVLQRHGHAGFDVRVGVHSGGVLLGGGVDTEGSIRGVTVHIAARMEQTAPSGGLRISRETYRQVRGMFEVSARGADGDQGRRRARHDLPRAACHGAHLRRRVARHRGRRDAAGRARRRARDAAR